MAYINRSGSSMDLLDESLDAPPGEISMRKRLLEAKQRTKSPFLIGSIDEVNRKISKLDHKLQGYTALVCESRASGKDEDSIYGLSSARGRDQYQQREKETKEVCKFAGIYTLKSTFVPNLSTRVKNISKISMKATKKKSSRVKKDEAGKPKFVELHQYPGFDTNELTPLPGGYTAHEVFDKVVGSSPTLNKKPLYKPEFDFLFYSGMSEAILLDMFWYLFLDKFQPSQNYQSKLFNRISHNYVKLMMTRIDPIAKDTFFKDLPKLMSQAIYASFCFCFPDSYRQFGESFKDELTFLVYGWMAGIRPAPRNWITWDMSHLEPPNLKMREELMQKKTNKKMTSLIDFDYLDSLISTNASQYASTMSLAQSASTGSNVNTARKPRMHARGSKTLKPTFRTSSPNKTHSPTSSHDNNLIEAVANAQNSPRYKGKEKRNSDFSLTPGKDGKRPNEALTPIRELASEDEEEDFDKKFSQISMSQIRDGRSKKDHVIESHPLGRGCGFVRTAFNVEGKSPLVAHFLHMKGLAQDVGQNIWIQRVEIDSLPPLDATTYMDLIGNSSKTIKKLESGFQEMYHKNYKASQKFMKHQQKILREHMQKQSALLANKEEVKVLCDLIILDQRKSQDSVSAGANAAIEAALMAQE